MQGIEAKVVDGNLVIKRLRARETTDDTLTVPIDTLLYNTVYCSNILITNAKYFNKIFLFEDMDDGENALVVYSDNKRVRYAYCSKDKAYKIFVKHKHKVLWLSLSKSKLQFIMTSCIINKYKLDIKSVKCYIDQTIYKEYKPLQFSEKPRNLTLLKKKAVYKFSFPVDDIICDDSEVNGRFCVEIDFGDIQITYGIAIPEKNIKNKRHYYAPIRSLFKREYAIHIRRTPRGNLMLVKRLREPYEYTLKFKIMESGFVSNLLYGISKILLKLRKKPINLYYEKFSSKAEEGSYDIFLDSLNSKTSKNYFIIDKNTEDYEKIKTTPNVVPKYSLKYYWLVFNAANFISTEAPIHLNILRSNNAAFRKSTCDKNFVFLQHGVTYLKCQGDRSTFTKDKEGEPTFIIVGSEKEKDVVVDMLRIGEERVWNTGLPIFSKIDYKHIDEKFDDTVTIMLTWKPYEEQLYSFEESSYYQNTMKIFEIVNRYVPKEKIMVIPHPKVLELMKTTSMSDSIWYGKISEVLEKTKLMITDYSSVCYNTFYQGGAVVFYQEDIEKYELENGKLIPSDEEYIGKRAFSFEEFEGIIKESIVDGKINLCELRTQTHEENYTTINEFSDGKNIKRICKKLRKAKMI